MSNTHYTVPVPKLWTNHANGVWTLTVDQRWGTVLTIGLVIWLGIVAATFWNITRFTLCQCATLRRSRSAFTTQLLVLLRNASSPLSFSWAATQLTHRYTNGKAWTAIPLVVLSLAVFAAFVAAKFFVSWVSDKAGDDYLISSRLTWTSQPTVDPWTARNTELSLLAQRRVTECVEENRKSPVCGLYPKPILNWTGSDGTCFLASPDLCRKGSTPFSLLSELLHSSKHLGINAPDRDAITYRRHTTCTPVALSGHTAVIKTDETIYANTFPPQDEQALVFLGPISNGSTSFENETFAYSTSSMAFPFAYSVKAVSSENYDWQPNSTFFERDDATISVFFLGSGHVIYSGPVNDPWFEAEGKFSLFVAPDVGMSYLWYPSYLITALACIDQHQVCNPDRINACTSWTASSNIFNAGSARRLHLNRAQVSTLALFHAVLQRSSMARSLSSLGFSGLLASRALVNVAPGIIQAPLPDDQWRLEMGNLFSMLLVRLQQQIIDTAPAVDNSIHQRINKNGSNFNGVNYNFTALLIILCIGLTLIVLGSCIDSIVFRIQKATGDWGVYQRKEWLYYGLHQILKRDLGSRGVVWDAPEDEYEEIPRSTDIVPARDEVYEPEQQVEMSPRLSEEGEYDKLPMPKVGLLPNARSGSSTRDGSTSWSHQSATTCDHDVQDQPSPRDQNQGRLGLELPQEELSFSRSEPCEDQYQSKETSDGQGNQVDSPIRRRTTWNESTSGNTALET